MSTTASKSSLTAAYGGETWSPRQSDRDDFVAAWGDWGVVVRVRHPARGAAAPPRPRTRRDRRLRAAQMRAPLNPDLARAQHDALADAYESQRRRRPPRRGGAARQAERALLPRPDADDPGRGDHRASRLHRARGRGALSWRRRSGGLGVPILMTVHGARHLRGRRRLLGQQGPLLPGRGAADESRRGRPGRARPARSARRGGRPRATPLRHDAPRRPAELPRPRPGGDLAAPHALHRLADAAGARLPLHRGRGRGRGAGVPADELRRARPRQDPDAGRRRHA